MPCVARAAHTRAPNFHHAAVYLQTMHPTQNAHVPCVVRAAHETMHAATPSARVVRAALESAPNFRHAAVHPQTMHPDKNAAVTCGVRAAHMHAPNVFCMVSREDTVRMHAYMLHVCALCAMLQTSCILVCSGQALCR